MGPYAVFMKIKIAAFDTAKLKKNEVPNKPTLILVQRLIILDFFKKCEDENACTASRCLHTLWLAVFLF